MLPGPAATGYTQHRSEGPVTLTHIKDDNGGRASVGLVLYRKSTGEGRVHYLTLAACLAGLGLVPLATAMTSRDMIAVMMLVLGAGYTAAVLLDDDEMREVMKGA